MRLFLLPISTRNALIYCARTPPKPGAKPSLVDRLTNKATTTWASWEKAESGWKKQLTTYGEKAMRRIPYQEWGLKTIPALNEARKKDVLAGKKVDVVFPSHFLPAARVEGVLRALATERQGLHKRRLIWSLIIMPFTAPFMLVPIIPNIPFFYVAFRAWSHWKALSGANHLQFLVDKQALKHTPSNLLDEGYAAGLMYPTREKSRVSPTPTAEQIGEIARTIDTKSDAPASMLLQRWNGKLLAERLELPDMEVEIERAVEQVQQGLIADETKEKAKQERAKAQESAGTRTEEINEKPHDMK